MFAGKLSRAGGHQNEPIRGVRMNHHKAATTRVKVDERRRLVRAAKYALVRGVAYATGSGAVGLLVWWLTNRH